MLLKLLSLAAQLSNSQNVFQPESNSTHNVSENLKIFLFSLKNSIYMQNTCLCWGSFLLNAKWTYVTYLSVVKYEDQQ